MRVIDQKEVIEERYAEYLKDESGVKGEARSLYFPETPAEVREILSRHYARKEPVTISNGRTGITAGAVPFGTSLVSLERLNRITRREQDLLRVEAGVSLQAIEDHLRSESPGLFYPVDVTEPSARIGGTIATDACGSRSLHYGRTREWIASLRVVLADGTEKVLHRGRTRAKGSRLDVLGRPLDLPLLRRLSVKNSAGYFIREDMDLIDLFIGSEGTLGVVTEADIRLARIPDNMITVLCLFPSEENGLDFFFSALKRLSPVHACEYFDKGSLDLLPDRFGLKGRGSALLLEMSGEEEQLEELSRLMEENRSDLSSTWTGEGEAGVKRIREFRHLVPETVNRLIAVRQAAYPVIRKVSTDIAVPMENLREMIGAYRQGLEKERIPSVLFGHIGEAHLHLNMIPEDEGQFARARELYSSFVKKAVALHGTFTAEHGVGRLKKEFMAYLYSPEEIGGMKRIKETLDPFMILNPGVLF